MFKGVRNKAGGGSEYEKGAVRGDVSRPNLRIYQAFLDVALPGLVIPDAALSLLMSEVHLFRHVTDPLRPIVFLVTRIARRFQVEFVGELPLLFDLISCLMTSKFRHFHLSKSNLALLQTFSPQVRTQPAKHKDANILT